MTEFQLPEGVLSQFDTLVRDTLENESFEEFEAAYRAILDSIYVQLVQGFGTARLNAAFQSAYGALGERVFFRPRLVGVPEELVNLVEMLFYLENSWHSIIEYQFLAYVLEHFLPEAQRDAMQQLVENNDILMDLFLYRIEHPELGDHDFELYDFQSLFENGNVQEFHCDENVCFIAPFRIPFSRQVVQDFLAMRGE